jgi:hypothetical protein
MKRIMSFITVLLLTLVTFTASAGPLTDYLEDQIVAHLFRTASFTKPTTLAVALYTTACSDTGGGTEVSNTGTAYARVSVNPADGTWAATSGGNGTTSNVSAVTFAQATADWGTVTHWSIVDSATYGAGNVLVCSALNASRNITTGADPSFPAGALTVQVDN